jgi:hypothetical protein
MAWIGDDPQPMDIEIVGQPHRFRVYKNGFLIGTFASIEAAAARLAEIEDDYSDCCQEPSP